MIPLSKEVLRTEMKSDCPGSVYQQTVALLSETEVLI